MKNHLSKTIKIKQKIEDKLYTFKILAPIFEYLIDALIKQGDLFIIGGFVRDIALNNESRDIDMISMASSHEIKKLLSLFNLRYSENRLGGFKIEFSNFEMDLWSINDNWAHKYKFLKISNVVTSENIAKSAFYNFDALAYSISNHSICFKFFRECLKTKELKILRKSIKYRQSNPTREANILRALYLKKKYDLVFSVEVLEYISQCLQYFEHISSANEILVKQLLKYYKYKNLLENEDFIHFFNRIDENNFKSNELETPNLFNLDGS